jgi:hypothetical protein
MVRLECGLVDDPENSGRLTRLVSGGDDYEDAQLASLEARAGAKVIIKRALSILQG